MMQNIFRLCLYFSFFTKTRLPEFCQLKLT